MDLTKEYLNIYDSLQAIDNELTLLPKGWIEHKVIDGVEREYYRYRQDGRVCYGDPNKLEENKQNVEHRKCLKKSKKVLQDRQKKLRSELKQEGLVPASIIRKHKINQRIEAQQEAKRKQERVKASKKKHPDNYMFTTDRGEIVASKSELMIANALYRKGISYQYEKEILLIGGRLKPDFTITYRGKTYYWEHNGMMDTESYRDDWNWRKGIYEENDIYEGVNLIASYETSKEPLKPETIERIIYIVFGV